MLTHTMRAFSLVGLILVAHTIKPFSLGNVTAFTRQTFRSFSFVLSEEALERLERTGELVALLGSGWGTNDDLTGRLAESLVAFKSDFSAANADHPIRLKAKSANKQLSSAGKTTRRFEKTARSLQARNRINFGAAPLPIIPGIEASLIPGATLMALPLSPTAADDPSPDLQGLFPDQPKLLNLDCEWRSSFAIEKTWITQGALLKLQEAQFPTLNVKVRALNQRASNGQACPQSGKATNARAGSGKQSC